MDQAAFEGVAASCAACHAECAPLCGRTEAPRRGAQYRRGLRVPQGDRGNAAHVAALIAEATPRSLQRLFTAAPGPTEPVIARRQA